MTTLASRTRVHVTEGGRLSATCVDCRTDLLLVPGADVADALAALDADHPARAHPRPARTAPDGWVLPLSTFVAWGR